LKKKRNSPWGSVFHENGEPTRFARFLAEVPDLYAPGLAEVLDHLIARSG
jgi:hypothetical protein